MDDLVGEQLSKTGNFFGRIVGSERSWPENALRVWDTLDGEPDELLLSHAPQEHLQGCAYNVYGHCHNNNERYPETFRETYPWLAENSEGHFNVGVELTGYRPVTPAELVSRRQTGEALV